jgi:hypothetical protein
MANSPPGPEHLAPSELHQTRQTAESFGENAERHDRTRPRYPVALIDESWTRCVPGQHYGRHEASHSFFRARSR